MKQKFRVTGMTCSACSAHVEKAVKKCAGVTSVAVNLLGNSMVVEGEFSADEILKSVRDAGYGAEPDAPDGAKPKLPESRDYAKEEIADMKGRFWTSLVFLLPLSLSQCPPISFSPHAPSLYSFPVLTRLRVSASKGSTSKWGE